MATVLEQLERYLSDRYSIRREVGRGGMATVYLAEDRKHHRQVAIKTLRPELAAGIAAERFLREIAIVATLNHPHILPLFDSGQAGNTLYFVMPFVEEESLRTRLRREGRLPVDEAIRFVDHVARALDYAHERGVIHRDIKPENVLLSAGQAVVSDFGIAYAVDAAGEGRMTRTGVAVGSPQYMSPEQAGEQSVDARSDIYSLACVLFEMLAGKPPFDGPSAMSVFAKHATEPPPRPGALRESVPSEVDRAVRKALAKHPSERFGTAGEFADAMTGAASVEARGSRWLARPRTGALGSWIRGSIVGVALIAGAWLSYQWVAGSGSRTGDTSLASAQLDPMRTAVLPFDILSPAEDVRSFARSLHARLVDGLALLEPIRVISPRGIGGASDSGVTVDSLARLLNVGTVVWPSMEAFGDSVRVRLRVLDGQTGEQLSSRTVKTALPRRLVLIDAVADTVRELLQVELGQTIEPRLKLLGTTSPEAFEKLLRAQEMEREFDDYLHDGDLESARRSLEEADRLLSEAEQLDSNWLEPILERGWLSQLAYQQAVAEQRPDAVRAFDVGVRHAERALEMRPGHPEALELRGALRFRIWQSDPHLSPEETGTLLELAERDLQGAREGNPHRARVLKTLSELMAATGRIEAAIRYGEEAYRRDPFLDNIGVIALRLFGYAFDAGRDSTAVRWCEEGLRRFPSPHEGFVFRHCRLKLMAWTDVYAPNPTEAWKLIDTMLQGHPRVPTGLETHLRGLAAMILARAGLPDSSMAVLESIREVWLLNRGTAIPTVGTLALLGQIDEARNLLDRYLSQNPSEESALARSRELRALREDPAFVNPLLPEMGR